MPQIKLDTTNQETLDRALHHIDKMFGELYGSPKNNGTYSQTVANLPAASAANKGMRTTITDGAATPVFGAVVAGSGSLILPVFSDGTNWRNG